MNSNAIQGTAAKPSATPHALLATLLRHRSLLGQLIRRDVAARYRGSAGGVLWSLLLPCAMLGIYLLMFGHIFVPVRGGGQAGAGTPFALTLFAGLLIHGLLAECLNRAPGAILGQPSYVKKVVFPLEVLPLTVVGTAVVQLMVGSVVLLAALGIWRGLSPSLLFLPLIWLPLVIFAAGMTMALSALTVYLRDLAQVTGFAATALLFLAPVFYALADAPPALQGWLLLNPLTIPVEGSRELLMHDRLPSASAWAWHALCSLQVLWAGWWVFQRTRRGFADVI